MAARRSGWRSRAALVWYGGSLFWPRTAAAVVLMSDATAWRLGERTASSGAASHGVRSAAGRAPEAAETPPPGGLARRPRPRRRPPEGNTTPRRNRNPHYNLTRTYILASGRGAAFVARRRTSCSGRPPAGGVAEQAANRFCQSSSDRSKRRGSCQGLPTRGSTYRRGAAPGGCPPTHQTAPCTTRPTRRRRPWTLARRSCGRG